MIEHLEGPKTQTKPPPMNFQQGEGITHRLEPARGAGTPTTLKELGALHGSCRGKHYTIYYMDTSRWARCPRDWSIRRDGEWGTMRWASDLPEELRRSSALMNALGWLTYWWHTHHPAIFVLGKHWAHRRMIQKLVMRDYWPHPEILDHEYTALPPSSACLYGASELDRVIALAAVTYLDMWDRDGMFSVCRNSALPLKEAKTIHKWDIALANQALTGLLRSSPRVKTRIFQWLTGTDLDWAEPKCKGVVSPSAFFKTCRMTHSMKPYWDSLIIHFKHFLHDTASMAHIVINDLPHFTGNLPRPLDAYSELSEESEWSWDRLLRVHDTYAEGISTELQNSLQ
jgi:hypothetical protein